MLVAVGAKLQVVHTWYKDINRLRPAYVLHVNTEFALHHLPFFPVSRLSPDCEYALRITDYLWVKWSRLGGGGLDNTDLPTQLARIF